MSDSDSIPAIQRARKPKKILTVERLRELFLYDPETGVFTRRVGTGCGGRPNQLQGTIAGYIRPDGYVGIGIDHTTHLAHRLAWLYVHGVWPLILIDHMDRVRDNNKLANLRLASAYENNQNRGSARSDSGSGLLGARWHKASKSWGSRIRVNGKEISLGYHATAESAHAAYLVAKRDMHPFQTIVPV